ncbi:MAG: cobalamin B12-binding domain-containing protein [Verrucomicrobia bacterium]|nr:cobalamin B12-binding domain-containing protein [Verrucomicrobiota bacterium]
MFIEGRERFDLSAWIAEHGRPEVVGISMITATVKRGYEIADDCRSRGIPVILGGPHVTFLPDKALAHAQFVVREEGEGAMSALLDAWSEGYEEATGTCYAAILNLSWKDDSGIIRHNAVAPWITDLDALPVPDFSLADGTADCVIGRKKTVMVQTSRGCPFDCSFFMPLVIMRGRTNTGVGLNSRKALALTRHYSLRTDPHLAPIRSAPFAIGTF